LDLVNIMFRLVLRNIQKNVYYMATVYIFGLKEQIVWPYRDYSLVSSLTDIS